MLAMASPCTAVTPSYTRMNSSLHMFRPPNCSLSRIPPKSSFTGKILQVPQNKVADINHQEAVAVGCKFGAEEKFTFPKNIGSSMKRLRSSVLLSHRKLGIQRQQIMKMPRKRGILLMLQTKFLEG
uniref:Uncharacterized protein n=1 Tax=Picea sitchensis TaxID=3332 RepID=A9P1V0_PICSI|nr:unknown [Picea sitchensis]